MNLYVTASALWLWIKALHIAFVVCWFAGLFYLPRLFVNHAMADDAATRERLILMERKLYRFMTPLAWLAVGFGLWLLYANWGFYIAQAWMQAKLALVVLLVLYHVACGRIVVDLAQGPSSRSHVFYRVFNELPVLILFGVIILVVVRPF